MPANPLNGQREILQVDVQQVSLITFGQFRQVMRRQAWSMEFIVRWCQPHLERPTDTVHRIMEGCRVNGRWDLLIDTVIPYPFLVELYIRATQPFSTTSEGKDCACGCGAPVRPNHKWATGACKQRGWRRSRTVQKPENGDHKINNLDVTE
jgi:hypothetical protein